MADKSDLLTEPGWPRPKHDGWPVPWVSPKDDLANMDPDRIVEIQTDRLCQVCGRGHAEDDTVYLVCNAGVEGTSVDTDVSDKTILSMDQSILHKHCAQMSVTLCPRLKSIRAAGKLIIVTALAKHVQLYSLPEGEDQVGVEGKHATFVGDSIP